MNQPKTSGRQVKTAERRRFILDLRKAGLTYAQIVEQAVKRFGVSNLPRSFDERYAYKDVRRELVRLQEQTADDAQSILEMELQRLDVMLVPLMAQARQGNHGAVDRVLRIMDRRAKYLGLDRPQEIRQTVGFDLDDWRRKRKSRVRSVQEMED